MRIPNFQFVDTEGRATSLYDRLNGQVTLVEFWATWCPKCCAELPNIITTVRENKQASLGLPSGVAAAIPGGGPAGRGFKVLAVAVQEPPGTLPAVLAANGWQRSDFLREFDHAALSSGQDANTQMRQMTGGTGIPANFLVTADGVIVDRNLKGAALRKALADMKAAGHMQR